MGVVSRLRKQDKKESLGDFNSQWFSFYNFRESKKYLLLQLQVSFFPPSQCFWESRPWKGSFEVMSSPSPSSHLWQAESDLTVKHEATHLLPRGSTDLSISQQRNIQTNKCLKAFVLPWKLASHPQTHNIETLPLEKKKRERESKTKKLDIL